jgi:hypothetical protein
MLPSWVSIDATNPVVLLLRLVPTTLICTDLEGNSVIPVLNGRKRAEFGALVVGSGPVFLQGYRPIYWRRSSFFDMPPRIGYLTASSSSWPAMQQSFAISVVSKTDERLISLN